MKTLPQHQVTTSGCLDFLEREVLLARTLSTFRKLNSRCMGMLECARDVNGWFSKHDTDFADDGSRSRQDSEGLAFQLGKTCQSFP